MWKFSIQFLFDLDLKSWQNEAQESSGINREIDCGTKKILQKGITMEPKSST